MQRWFNLSTMDEQTAVSTLVRHLQTVLEGRADWERRIVGERKITRYGAGGNTSETALSLHLAV